MRPDVRQDFARASRNGSSTQGIRRRSLSVQPSKSLLDAASDLQRHGQSLAYVAVDGKPEATGMLHAQGLRVL